MLKKMPLRLRLTVLSVLLLAVCCVGLTAILNLSANHMANVIEATVLTPAQTVPSEETAGFPALGIAPSLPASGVQAARSQFLYQSVFFLLFVVALGGVLIYWLSGKALAPLGELSAQMQNRTVHNLSQALPVPESHDEIADLTQSFNEMSLKLEAAFAMQKRFSQSAAHELRTPLTVLKTKVDVFQKKSAHSPAEYDQLLTVLVTHTNRLADLVQELLTLTNMDALPQNEVVALYAVLGEVAEELSGLAGEKHIALTVDGEAQTVAGNRSLLHRALYNLVENAIKYNVPGGSVALRLSAAGGHSVITVADSGIGIPPEARALIFEPFYRVDKSRSRQMGGAGLGLSLVKSIVQQHGGTVTLGDNPGGGTLFEIIL
ncbi:MAG: HAMP domain-containing sensor histidine kinase [Oscillibacter sp.]